jgi:general secretion pathway protein D
MTRTNVMLVAVAFAFAGAPLSAQDSPRPDPRSSPAASPSAEERAEAEPRIELQTLLEQVAANSDKQFLVDHRSKQQVYVGGTPIEKPDYPVLLSILRNNGLVAVEIEGRVNVMPSDIARQLPLPLVQRDDPRIPDDEWVSRVITVANGNASYLVPILRPLLPQQGHLAAIGGEEHNKLLIVDSYANVKRITEIVNALYE